MTEEDNNREDENKLIAQRRDKLKALREAGQAYPNDFRRDALAEHIHGLYGRRSNKSLEKGNIKVSVAGRMMAKRVMGKASFAQLQDMTGRIQLFVQRDGIGEQAYQDFKSWDVGDIVGATGTLFRTKTDELSIRVTELQMLAKSLRPLPAKWHGLTDRETRYRQRYLDLIINPGSRAVYEVRSQIIRYLRQFFDSLGFVEVETPMLQPLPGGAAARPFVTHYQALDSDFYLRIAPELYLKRLVVGGIEQVYEINRNFRNEGLSTKHNPEFTMLEFYKAYADYLELMDLIEAMLRDVADAVLGMEEVDYQGQTLYIAKPFQRQTMREAVAAHTELEAERLTDQDYLTQAAKQLDIKVESDWGSGKLQMEIFEKAVEDRLIQPTFITEFPAEVSPLARRNDEDPSVTDRFELFIAGREIANGFSELNDPEDQAARFQAQAEAKQAGDAEAMYYDEDYVRALEHGMPPTAGAGIGIDRLVMLFTDSASIRDVLLFPQLRPEA